MQIKIRDTNLWVQGMLPYSTKAILYSSAPMCRHLSHAYSTYMSFSRHSTIIMRENRTLKKIYHVMNSNTILEKIVYTYAMSCHVICFLFGLFPTYLNGSWCDDICIEIPKTQQNMIKCNSRINRFHQKISWVVTASEKWSDWEKKRCPSNLNTYPNTKRRHSDPFLMQGPISE